MSAATVLVSVALLAVVWAIWIVLTPDYQGGRHFAGFLMLSVGLIIGALGLTLGLVSRSPTRSGHGQEGDRPTGSPEDT
jgi:hypothetical protein